MQKLMGLVRRCVDDYDMIQDGDKIAVGVSGGKDSLALLVLMAGLQKYYPKKFELEAITVDMGLPGMDFSPVAALCERLHVPYTCLHTEIGPIVFEARKEKNPCSLCAKMRKGALNEAALSLGCTKIAYAHHKDDFIETLMMNLLQEGRCECFPPVTRLDKTGLAVLRPMLYVEERDVIGFTRKYALPVAKNPCPADGATRREDVKHFIRASRAQFPNIRESLFSAVERLFEEDHHA